MNLDIFLQKSSNIFAENRLLKFVVVALGIAVVINTAGLFMALNSNPDYNEWMDIYKKLVYWELELELSDDAGMYEVFKLQKSEAGLGFSRFIRTNYLSWFTEKSVDKPLSLAA